MGYALSEDRKRFNLRAGRVIRNIRNARGILMPDLARKLRISESYLSNIETGKTSLRLYDAINIQKILKMRFK